MSRIVRVFLDTDLRCAHAGLTELADKHGVDTQSLDDGEFMVFINRRKTMMKCFVAGNTISHTKGHITLQALQYLPQHFGADGILDYRGAVKTMLKKTLKPS